MVDREEIEEHQCQACEFLHKLYLEWERWKGDVETGELGDPTAIDEAYAAMEFESYFTTFNLGPSEISMKEYAWVTTVRAEYSRMRAQENFKHWQEGQSRK